MRPLKICGAAFIAEVIGSFPGIFRVPREIPRCLLTASFSASLHIFFVWRSLVPTVLAASISPWQKDINDEIPTQFLLQKLHNYHTFTSNSIGDTNPSHGQDNIPSVMLGLYDRKYLLKTFAGWGIGQSLITSNDIKETNVYAGILLYHSGMEPRIIESELMITVLCSLKPEVKGYWKKWW